MNKTLDLPLLGLNDEFPDVLFVIHHKPTLKYGCYCHKGIFGLACFSKEEFALEFCEYLELDGMIIVEVDFEQAREIAKSRPMPVVSVMLADTLSDPKIHYVR